MSRVTTRHSLLLLSIALIVALGPASRAEAHAIVRTTAPQADEVVEDPPEQVVMEFNEPVEINFGAIRVFETNGDRVDVGATEHLEGHDDAIRVRLDPDLRPGTYTVAWQVISSDGHPIEEAFVFHVEHPGVNPEGIGSRVLRGDSRTGRIDAIGYAAVRWLNLAALILLAGAFFFPLLVWTGKRIPSVPWKAHEIFRRRQRFIIVLSWITLVVGTLAAFAFQGAVATQRSLVGAMSPDVLEAVAGTRFGRLALVRLGLLALAAILWKVLVPRWTASEARSLGAAGVVDSPPRWAAATSTVLIVALLTTPGLAGHAGTTPPVALHVTVDALHMIGASVWIGGLVVLLTAALPAAGTLERSDRIATIAPVVARFSDLAVIAVAIMVLTGTYAAFVQVGGLSVLFEAPYGLVLVAKIAVFLPLLGLGAVNKFWIRPRLSRGVYAVGTASEPPISLFRNLVAAEVVLALAVIAVTAFLVNLAPARNVLAARSGVEKRIEISGEPYVVTIKPNRVGNNTIDILPLAMNEDTQQGHDGETEAMDEDPAAPKEVRVLFRMPSEGIGPLRVPGEEVTAGHFVVRGHQLSVPGRWKLEIVARVDRFDEERVHIEFDVNP